MMNFYASRSTPITVVMSIAAILSAAHLLFAVVLSMDASGPLHHDLSSHEQQQGHPSCPGEIHQFTRSDDTTNVTDVSALCPTPHDLRPAFSYDFALIPYSSPPRSDLPIERKTVLLI